MPCYGSKYVDQTNFRQQILCCGDYIVAQTQAGTVLTGLCCAQWQPCSTGSFSADYKLDSTEPDTPFSW